LPAKPKRPPIAPPHKQNSAGRLLVVLKAFAGAGSLYVVLSKLEGYEPSTAPGTITNGVEQQKMVEAANRFLAEVQRLHQQLVDDLDSCTLTSSQKRSFSESLVGLREIITPMDLAPATRSLREMEIHVLTILAEFLDEETPLATDDIDSIRESIESLRGVVANANISPVLKKALKELIRLSEDAINRFDIHGAKGLRRAFKTMLVESAEIMEEAKKEQGEAGTVSKLVYKHLMTFDAVVTKVGNYTPFLTYVSGFLTSP
jgi:hypothetical protein